MRIVAGKWRGTNLHPPAGHQTRPILDHVKEALFNILGARLAFPGTLPPCMVLDLFSGTGSLGLESLSRGAAHCTFVEAHPGTVDRLRKNLRKLEAEPLSNVLVVDAWHLQATCLSPPEPYRIVFVDPPFQDARTFERSSRVYRLLADLRGSPRVDRAALIILRHPRKAVCRPQTFDGLDLVDQRTYGQMTLSVLQPCQT